MTFYSHDRFISLTPNVPEMTSIAPVPTVVYWMYGSGIPAFLNISFV